MGCGRSLPAPSDEADEATPASLGKTLTEDPQRCFGGCFGKGASGAARAPGNNADAPRASAAKAQELQPWEQALAPLVAALAAHESTRLRAAPLCWQASEEGSGGEVEGVEGGGILAESESDGERAGGQSWSSAFPALQRRPLDEVLAQLSRLGTRPWQLIWRSLLHDFSASLRGQHCRLLSPAITSLARLLPPGDADSKGAEEGGVGAGLRCAWDDACRALHQEAIGGEASPEAAQAERRQALRALRRLLRLQEQLSWLARVMATALALEELHEPLATALRLGPVRGAPASRADQLLRMACAGFILQGVGFRIIAGEEDWRTVCAEFARPNLSRGANIGLDGALAPFRLFIAVEGLGVRLLAVPVDSPLGLEAKGATSVTPHPRVVRVASAFLRQCRIMVPDAATLGTWCAALPNPRGLHNLEVPFARVAAYTRVASNEDVPFPCLGLVFSPGNKIGSSCNLFTAKRCAEPEIVAATSQKILLRSVAAALACTPQELIKYTPDAEGERVDIFGCPCDVWYLLQTEGASSGGAPVWRWQSDRFALCFFAPVVSLDCGNDVDGFDGAKTISAAAETEPAAGSQLHERLEAARISLGCKISASRSPSCAWDPRAPKKALRAHGFSARFACALVEPRLGHAGKVAATAIIPDEGESDNPDDAIHEIIGADVLARAGKHVLRTLVDLSTSGVNKRGSRVRGPVRFELVAGFVAQHRRAIVAVPPALSTLAPSGNRVNSKPPDFDEHVSKIEAEPPIPPLPPRRPSMEDGVTANTGRGSSTGGSASSYASTSSSSMLACCSAALETEVQNLLTALEIHPELDQVIKDIPALEMLAACRVGLLHVAAWARLASAALELVALQGWSRPAPALEAAASELAALLPPLGRRLFRAARSAPPTLVVALASQLGVEFTPSVMRRARPLPNFALDDVVMQVPLGQQAFEQVSPDIRVVQTAFFTTKAAVTLEGVLADALAVATASVDAASVAAPTPEVAALFFDADLEVSPLGRHGRLLPTAYALAVPAKVALSDMLPESFADAPPSPASSSTRSLSEALRREQGKWLPPPAMASLEGDSAVDGQTTVAASAQTPHTAGNGWESAGFAAAVVAAVRTSRQMQDQSLPHHRVQRAKDLLRATQWLLHACMREACVLPFAAASADSPLEDARRPSPYTPPKPADPDGEGRSGTVDGAAVARVLLVSLQILQTVQAILGDLGYCPPELLVAFWALRGYTQEKRGRIDVCYLDYLQALSLLDESWGDPRMRGGRGHPFAMLLAWKLGLISYCRGDVKSIDKFADYFRSLALYFTCPFPWGPPTATPDLGGAATTVGAVGAAGAYGANGMPTPAVIGEEEIGGMLWASEALLWACGGLRTWWRRHDVLSYRCHRTALPRACQLPALANSGAAEAAGPACTTAGVGAPAAVTEMPAQGTVRRELVLPEGGVTGDLQEVRRGTLFAFGSNQLGQLGVGRPTTKARLKAATAEPTPPGLTEGSDIWWSARPVRVMALKEHRVKEIACGESHCVVIDVEGRLHAWGGDEWGQVGAPRRRTEAAPEDAHPLDATEHCVYWPVCVSLHLERREARLVRFAAVACGAQFSVALDISGAIWTWGHGEGGVLGQGAPSLVGTSRPAHLKTLLARGRCSAVACGSYHASALVGDGVLYTWGRAEGGQLGVSETSIERHIEALELQDTCICEPLRVSFEKKGRIEGGASAVVFDQYDDDASSDPVRLKQVSCGDVHTCALDSSGQIWSWGWGEFGQLGLGFSSATYELGTGGASSRRETPEPVEAVHFGGAQLGLIACGGAFSAAVADPAGEGSLFLWGANEVGQCALPAKDTHEVEVPKQVFSLAHVAIRHVACGGSHSIAVDAAGRAYAWGAAQYGQLGSAGPPRTFAPPPALLTQNAKEAAALAGVLAQHVPTVIQSVSRLAITKAACGLYHTLLVSDIASSDKARPQRALTAAAAAAASTSNAATGAAEHDSAAADAVLMVASSAAAFPAAEGGEEDMQETLS